MKRGQRGTRGTDQPRRSGSGLRDVIAATFSYLYKNQAPDIWLRITLLRRNAKWGDRNFFLRFLSIACPALYRSTGWRVCEVPYNLVPGFNYEFS